MIDAKREKKEKISRKVHRGQKNSSRLLIVGFCNCDSVIISYVIAIMTFCSLLFYLPEPETAK